MSCPCLPLSLLHQHSEPPFINLAPLELLVDLPFKKKDRADKWSARPISVSFSYSPGLLRRLSAIPIAFEGNLVWFRRFGHLMRRLLEVSSVQSFGLREFPIACVAHEVKRPYSCRCESIKASGGMYMLPTCPQGWREQTFAGLQSLSQSAITLADVESCPAAAPRRAFKYHVAGSYLLSKVTSLHIPICHWILCIAH
ncbi:hypothetical protein P389DRAFT_41648 [Cystobasidium minutum MCA 4210]|uniref:uncharacterized protein n=1 Tax=Cystobasidium minutum MCA 4210 TaxID=1397322 RepID=UPI0034CE3A9C|eukprot:jgi/Rhomi1/41648/CE41647_151